VVFHEGRAVDLVEIDAASNRGIDEIRNLKEAVRFPPVYTRFKMYLIDEAHMLTKEAFNALLKMLEEPPAFVLFVLATTEVGKVPETIRSRCQRFDFGRLHFEALRERLKNLCGREEVATEEQAIALLARFADGSARDAESLLDQVLSTAPQRLTYDHICAVLGLAPQEILADFFSALCEKDAPKALAALQRAYEHEADPSQVLREVIHFLRDGMMLALDDGKTLVPLLVRERGYEYVEWLKGLLAGRDAAPLRELLDIFLVASVRMRHTPLPQLPLELAVMDATQGENSKIQIPNTK